MIDRLVTDLPEPDSPTTASVSPVFSANETSSTQCLPQFRIEQVAEAVAHHLQRQRGKHDRHAREHDEPECLMRKLLAAGDHRPPRR